MAGSVPPAPPTSTSTPRAADESAPAPKGASGSGGRREGLPATVVDGEDRGARRGPGPAAAVNVPTAGAMAEPDVPTRSFRPEEHRRGSRLRLRHSVASLQQAVRTVSAARPEALRLVDEYGPTIRRMFDSVTASKGLTATAREAAYARAFAAMRTAIGHVGVKQDLPGDARGHYVGGGKIMISPAYALDPGRYRASGETLPNTVAHTMLHEALHVALSEIPELDHPGQDHDYMIPFGLM